MTAPAGRLTGDGLTLSGSGQFATNNQTFVGRKAWGKLRMALAVSQPGKPAEGHPATRDRQRAASWQYRQGYGLNNR